MGKKHYPSDLVRTQGRITGRIAETAFRAILVNGKSTVAFVEKKNAPLRERISTGDVVRLAICPSDFDRARIDGIV